MSISKSFADSHIAFESLRAAAKEKEIHHGETMAVVAREFDRYTVWADKFGAARSGKDFRLSLDYQLREASFYRDQVARLLQNLQENAEKALFLLSGEHKVESVAIERPDAPDGRDEAGDKLPGIEEEKITKGAEVNNEEAQKETEGTGEDVPKTRTLSPDFWTLMSSINSTITTLEKVPVRNLNPINEVSDDELAGGIAREHFDILHVRDKLPDKNLDPNVVTRLGKMITRRRQLLESLRSRRDEFRMSVASAPVPSPQKVAATAVLDAPPNTTATEKVQDRGSKPLPRIRDSVLYAPSEPDSTSQSSAGKQDGGQHAQIPPRPRNSAGLGMTRFECRYCFMTPYIPSDAAWKKHILRDLQPYICTFVACSTVNRVFENRDAWWAHEIAHHRSQYYCNTPGHARYREQATFQVHMREEHGARLVQDELLARFRRPLSGQGGRCNLCALETRDLKRHVARHLEQLALFSIPRSDFDDVDAAGAAGLKSENRHSTGTAAKSSPIVRKDSKAKSANSEEKVEPILEGMMVEGPEETSDDDDSSTTATRSTTFRPSPKDTATTQSLFRRSESRGNSPISVPISNPYKRVGVLMFTWSDPRPTTSFFDLEHTLRSRYRFDVRVEEIPIDGDVSQNFTRGVSDLIRAFSGRSDLMIIYYAGRARFLGRSQDLEFRSNRDFFEFDAPCASMSWKLIESKLLADNAVKSDVLAVLEDSAAIDFASGNEISQILETPEVHSASAASSSSVSSDQSGEVEKRDRCFQFLTMRRTTPYPQASFTEALNQVLLDSTAGIDASDLAYHMTLQNEHGHSTRNPCFVFHRLNPPGRDIALTPLPEPKGEEPTPSDAKTPTADEEKGIGEIAQAETEADGQADADTAPASPAPSNMSVSNHPLVLMAKQVTLKPFVWPAQSNPHSTEHVSVPRTNRDRLLVPDSASSSSPSPIVARSSNITTTGDDRGVAAGPVVERKHFSLLHPRFPFRHQRDQRYQQDRRLDIRAQHLSSFSFDQVLPARQDHTQTPSSLRLPRRRKPNAASASDNNLDLPSTLSLSLSLSLSTPTLSLPATAVPPNFGLGAYDNDDDENAAPSPTIERQRPSTVMLSRRNTIAAPPFLAGVGLYAPQQPRRLSRSTYNHMRSASQGHNQPQSQSRTLTLNPRNTDTRSIMLDAASAYPYGGVGLGGGYVVDEEDADDEAEAADDVDVGVDAAAPAPQVPTHIQRPASSSRSSLRIFSSSLSRHGSFTARRRTLTSGSTPTLASSSFVTTMLSPAAGPVYSPAASKMRDVVGAADGVLLSKASLAASPSQSPERDKEPLKEQQGLKRASSMSFRHSLSLRRSIKGSLRRSATLIGVVGGGESARSKAPIVPSPPGDAAAGKETECLHIDAITSTADATDDPFVTKPPPPEQTPTRPSTSPPPQTDHSIHLITPLPHIPSISFPILSSSLSHADIASIPIPPTPPEDAPYISGGTLRRSPWGSVRRGRSLRRSISGLFSAGGGRSEGKGKGEAGGRDEEKQSPSASQSRPLPATATATSQKSGDDALAGGRAPPTTGSVAPPVASTTNHPPTHRASISEMEKKAKKKRSRAELWAGFRAGVSRRAA